MFNQDKRFGLTPATVTPAAASARGARITDALESATDCASAELESAAATSTAAEDDGLKPAGTLQGRPAGDDNAWELAIGADTWRREATAPSAVAESTAAGSRAAPPEGRWEPPPRGETCTLDPAPAPPLRDTRTGRDVAEESERAESEAADPAAPAKPVVSANATGITIAEPIPNATASEPTRPTYRATPEDGTSPTPDQRPSTRPAPSQPLKTS